MFHDPTWEILFTSVLMMNAAPAGCVRADDSKKDYSKEADAQYASYLRTLQTSGSAGGSNGLGSSRLNSGYCSFCSTGWK